MSKNVKRISMWLIVGLLVVGGFVGIILANRGGNTGGAIPAVTADEWFKGNPEAKITLVEYSDFQCPACKSREPLVSRLIGEFSNHIKFVYRHFPLRSIHQNAQLAAQASEAAGLQGKFWEMHDVIFANQTGWSAFTRGDAEDAFIGYAENLGLDVEKFSKDLNSDTTEDAVNEDLEGGEGAGVNSTPTFFLNGSMIQSNSYEEYRALIRQAIEHGAEGDKTASNAAK